MIQLIMTTARRTANCWIYYRAALARLRDSNWKPLRRRSNLRQPIGSYIYKLVAQCTQKGKSIDKAIEFAQSELEGLMRT